MGFGIRLHVWGERACFTRPEMKAERVSYDVMTPSAARGILEAIHWKPAIAWRIDRIHVLKPIRFQNVRRNEVGSKASIAIAGRAVRSGDLAGMGIDAHGDRLQRAATLLVDVGYVVEAHFEMTVHAGTDSPAKHLAMFNRRAETGQCFHRPCLGTREFPALFELLPEGAELPATELDPGERDLGWMLHDIDFANGNTSRFFRARIRDGHDRCEPMCRGKRSRCMILQALDSYYDRLPNMVAPGWSNEPIGVVLELAPGGTLLAVDTWLDERRKPRFVRVPKWFSRSGNGSTPYFAWDNAAYVLGLGAKDPGKTARDHDAFKTLHLTELADDKDEGLIALRKFLEGWVSHRDRVPTLSDKQLTYNIAFRFQGDNQLLHERPAVAAHVERLRLVDKSEAEGFCLVRGARLPLVAPSPKNQRRR